MLNLIRNHLCHVSTLTLLTLVGTTQVAKSASFEGTLGDITFGTPTPIPTLNPRIVFNIFIGNGIYRVETGEPEVGSTSNIFALERLDFSTTDNTQFAIANLSYTNGETLIYTDGDTSINTVPVNFILDFSNPSGISELFTFTFSLDLTPNDTDDPVRDADTLTILDVNSSTNFAVGDDLFTLELLGFSDDEGVTIDNVFTLPENMRTTSQLFAQITSLSQDVPADVPEPGLTGFITFGIGAFLIKNHSKVKAIANRKNSD